MPDTLTGKIAVISGGSRGIGFAVAHKLAQEGCDCLLVASSEDNLNRAAQQIVDATGRRVKVCATDLRTLEGCQMVYDRANEVFGRVDILVNNAGATQSGPFLELDDDAWEDGFALKFYAAVRLSRLFWHMLKDSHGTVININGGAARQPSPNFMIGGAVNAAYANFSKALSKLGLQDDVNVNTIHPGLTNTDRVKDLFERQMQAEGITLEEAQQRAIASSGIRRMGEPEDVAALAWFLCTPQARHIQGTAISVDGGATTGLY